MAVESKAQRHQSVRVIDRSPQFIKVAEQFVQVRQGGRGLVFAELNLLGVAEVVEVRGRRTRRPSIPRTRHQRPVGGHVGSLGGRVVRRRTTGFDESGSGSSPPSGALCSRVAADATASLLVSVRPVMSSVCGISRDTTLRWRPGSSLPPPAPPPPGAPAPMPPIGIPMPPIWPPIPPAAGAGVVAPTGVTVGVGGAPVDGATPREAGAPSPPAGVVGASPPPTPSPIPPSPRPSPNPESNGSIFGCPSPERPCVAAPIAWLPACIRDWGTLVAAPIRPPARPPT